MIQFVILKTRAFSSEAKERWPI